MKVTDAEINARQHDDYLKVISTHASPLGERMASMGETAGRAARSQTLADFAAAVNAMNAVSEEAALFLNALASSDCPGYLRGADSQIQDALKLLVDGGRRGAEAAEAADGVRVAAAARGMEVANGDIVAAAHLLTAWRSGAARP
ncbi:MAG: hypothetical protein M3082_17435 [Candidatus Dormibacteraeota bacterium]|nr:hypothetical protein [Candidatus Dormibacteraeota bacterium]